MENINFSNTVQSLLHGMDNFISTKTVVGEAIRIDKDTTIIPLVDVSFGVAAGAGTDGDNCDHKSGGGAGGGMGGKIQPSAVLVVSNGTTKLVNVKNQEGLTKVLDMVPDLVNKFSSMVGKDKGADPGMHQVEDVCE
jgi:uncharacterized spore protein YtfJ